MLYNPTWSLWGVVSDRRFDNTDDDNADDKADPKPAAVSPEEAGTAVRGDPTEWVSGEFDGDFVMMQSQSGGYAEPGTIGRLSQSAP